MNSFTQLLHFAISSLPPLVHANRVRYALQYWLTNHASIFSIYGASQQCITTCSTPNSEQLSYFALIQCLPLIKALLCSVHISSVPSRSFVRKQPLNSYRGWHAMFHSRDMLNSLFRVISFISQVMGPWSDALSLIQVPEFRAEACVRMPRGILIACAPCFLSPIMSLSVG